MICRMGAVGVFVGYASNRLLQAAIPALPFGEMLRFELPLDFRVLVYSGSIALLTSLLFGLPLTSESRDDPAAYAERRQADCGLRLRLATLTVTDHTSSWCCC